MRIASVRIGTLTFPIRFMHPEETDGNTTLGEFSQRDGIFINANQDPATMASTVMHECIHAMHYVYKMPRKILSEERLCEIMEGPMTAFISDNPHLVKAMSAASKRGMRFDFLEPED